MKNNNNENQIGPNPASVPEKDTDILVIQTETGKEQELIHWIDVILDAPVAIDAFAPLREMRKHFGGQWNLVTEKMYPGYVFIETAEPETLYFNLKNIPKLSKVLGQAELHFHTLSPDEESFIRRIGQGRNDHTFKLSQVAFNEGTKSLNPGDRVRVVSGDLKGFEGEIIGYNLRRRVAKIKTEMFGGSVIYVGIEIINIHDSDSKQ